jgi:hypothetical protein
VVVTTTFNISCTSLTYSTTGYSFAIYFYCQILESIENQPYHRLCRILKILLSNLQSHKVLLNDIVVMLVIDPLNWDPPYLLQPVLHVRDDVDLVEWQCPYIIGQQFD